MHLQNGAIKDHLNSIHPTIPLTDRRNILVNNTHIMKKNNNLKLLQITEAMYIKEFHPTLNIQGAIMGGVLKLFPPS